MATSNFSEAWYLGLDIGTSSVGWAVTDEHYHIPRLRGQRAWGVRLFDEAQTAADRRLRRGARRRYFRRAERLKYLRRIFEPLITPIDPHFFQRMKDSFLWEDDKSEKQSNSLFNDPDYTDKDYYRDFPTIFHLRKYLMDNKDIQNGETGDIDKGENNHSKKIDARHYYLACHHIIKYRGHFLFEGEHKLETSDTAAKFNELFKDLQKELDELYGFGFEANTCSVFLDLLSSKKSINERKAEVKDIEDIPSHQDEDADKEELAKRVKAIKDFLVGSSTEVAKLTEADSKKKIQLGIGDFDAKITEVSNEFGTQIETLLSIAHDLFNIGIARRIMGDATSISEAYIKLYDQIGNKNSMSGKSVLDVYNSSKPDKGQTRKLTDARAADEGNEQKTIEKPKLRGHFKGAIPMQYNLNELHEIVNGLGKAYPEFLTQMTAFKDDCTQVEDSKKLVKLLTHRVPYYVGPLKSNPNEYETAKTDRQKPWAICNAGKEQCKIYPWNFDEVIDKAASAKAFILRMTNSCTYLSDQSCLPKDSILYQRYLILNELNKMKIDGNAIDVATKQKLFNELFLTTPQITLKTIKEWCRASCLSNEVSIADAEGTGGTINHKMTSYLLFKEVFGERTDVLLPKIEQAIQYITLLPDDREMLEQQLGELFKDEQIDEPAIKQIARFKMSKWGNFSEKLLSGLTESIVGVDKSIIDLMWETNDNFMEIYHKYFETQITDYQKVTGKLKDDDAFIDESYASVPIKRSARQAIKIVRELEKIIGSAPKKVFIEAPRSKEDSERTVGRKQQLGKLYKDIKIDIAEVAQELKGRENIDLKPKRVYLYFLQKGRCAYSGERLNIDALSEECQIDHIVPQSMLKDDSFDNTVLVKKEYNQKKGDTYPLNLVTGIEFNKRLQEWRTWHKQGLISDKKLRNLTRTTLTTDELAGFINRQLVETSQTTKMVMDILKRVMPDTEVVYQKAETVAEFKREWTEYEGTFEGPADNKYFVPERDEKGNKIVKRIIKPRYIKLREMNDLHHAKDAYLNIVVGNVYSCRFTNNPRTWLRKEFPHANYSGAGHKMHMSKILFNDKTNEVQTVADTQTGEVVWGKEHLDTVNATMARNDIKVTVRTYIKSGKIYDETIHGASSKYFPVKKKFQRKTDRYGGYTGNYTAYFVYLMDKKGKKRFAAVPVRHSNNPAAYLKSEYPDAYILMDCIPIKSHLIVGGHHVILNGNFGNYMVVGQFKQLVLSDLETGYLQKVLKVQARIMGDKKYVLNWRDGITPEDNSRLYKSFLVLAEGAYRKRPKISSVVELLETEKERFEQLSLADQVFMLTEILNLFRFVPTGASEVNCKLLGGKEHIGGTYFSTYETNIKLVIDSVTGLYSHEIDLSLL